MAGQAEPRQHYFSHHAPHATVSVIPIASRLDEGPGEIPAPEAVRRELAGRDPRSQIVYSGDPGLTCIWTLTTTKPCDPRIRLWAVIAIKLRIPGLGALIEETTRHGVTKYSCHAATDVRDLIREGLSHP